MDDQIQKDFLRKRMIELREKNHKTQSDMAELIGCNKSTLSRAEKIGGDTSYKTVLGFAHDYCDKLGLTSRQKDQFLRGDRVVVTDTSALLKNSQLIDELSREYSRVIVPDIVVEELDSIKDHNPKLAKKAWQILKSIGSGSNVTTGNPAGERKAGSYDGQDVKAAEGAGRNPPGKGRTGNPDGQDVKAAEGAGRNPPGKGRPGNPDAQIVKVAEKAAEEFHCQVDIITYDAGFAARLSGHATVKALYLEEYMVTKQNLMDIQSLKKINAYYADSYEDMESVPGVTIPNREDINAYLPEGNTLIISVVRNRNKPMNQRKEKIRWLIGHGADVDRRDCGKYYFPPLSHAIQNRDFEMFRFLLHECRANPNVGSGRESLRNAEEVISFFRPFGTKVTFSRMIGKYGISLGEYRDFMDRAGKELPVRRGGLDCTMYGGLCGAGTNNYFFANGKTYYCGNCIDLPPVGDSGISLEELEKISLTFDRSCCYKEFLGCYTA